MGMATNAIHKNSTELLMQNCLSTVKKSRINDDENVDSRVNSLEHVELLIGRVVVGFCQLSRSEGVGPLRASILRKSASDH